MMIKEMTNKGIDIDLVRKEFPILNQKVFGRDLIYLDNAATSQKPYSVIKSITDYYSTINSNIHRGVHHLSEQATEAYEASRQSAADFINADNNEIIFTRGTTEAINLVTQTIGRATLKTGDEVLITVMEHHSNIVPWQMICEEKGAILKVANIDETGTLDLDHFKSLLSDQTKFVAFNHASNSLGTINPVKELTRLAHDVGALVLIDGAQSAPHIKVDVNDLDCDFYAFSSHKMYGPTGVGVLFGKKSLLDSMPPYQGGGEMIKEVTFESTTYNEVPHKFEAGTPNIADVVAFKEAIKFIEGIGHQNIVEHENALLLAASNKLNDIDGLKIIGSSRNKVAVVSFVVEGTHPLDIGTMLNTEGIAVRTGHHCTQPIMDKFCIPGTVRASFAVYNTLDEVDYFVEILKKTIKLLRP